MEIDRNNLAFWYPRVMRSGVRAPMTQVIHTPINLVNLLDGVEPEGFAEFLELLQLAGDAVGWPCFLRSGLVSGKHTGRNSSVVQSPETLKIAVFDIQEFAAMAEVPGGWAQHTWAVRELIPLAPAFTHNGGLPITSEVRCFVERTDSGVKFLKWLHYWPHEAIRRPSCEDWAERLDRLNKVSSEEESNFGGDAEKVTRRLPVGNWSIDFIRCANKSWWCIDLAVGEQSWGWDLTREV